VYELKDLRLKKVVSFYDNKNMKGDLKIKVKVKVNVYLYSASS